MSLTDWLVLAVTLLIIIIYGVYKGRGQQDSQSYLLADKKMPWYVVMLGIMSTQASAITFLSAPGQAYTDGMRFVQYYFGLPLAMIVICVTFIPIFQKLNVCTAYEFLENRFDRKTRILTSLLFLLSRGLSTGISIYAPSIILSSILGLNIYLTNIITGSLLIIYTYSGGAKAVAHTQKLQFLIILAAMCFTGYLIMTKMPAGINMDDALYIAGKSGKLNVITTGFDWKDRYNIWSGIIGGFFLALSYFGTDQSQVGRYISAKDNNASRLGLLLNGLVKIPMQFAILLIGALLFAFYSLTPGPVYFNESSYGAYKKDWPEKAASIENEYRQLQQLHQNQTQYLLKNRNDDPERQSSAIEKFQQTQHGLQELHKKVEEELNVNHYNTDTTDTNYIFLYFVKNSLPKGLIGLLFAVIFLASWGSISAALNSLAASSLTDIQCLIKKTKLSGSQELIYGRLHTLCWGVFSIMVAMFAAQMGSLIEAVNILGSLFYGPILGIFLVAFYIKPVRGSTVFIAALLAELLVVTVYKLDIVSFLWLNVIGAFAVVFISLFDLAYRFIRTGKFNNPGTLT